jgi:hypothetical protein
MKMATERLFKLSSLGPFQIFPNGRSRVELRNVWRFSFFLFFFQSSPQDLDKDGKIKFKQRIVLSQQEKVQNKSQEMFS